MQKPKINPSEGRRALREHVVERALLARERYGGSIDYPTLLKMLEDRQVVRYPTVLEFSDSALQPGEFAYVAPVGEAPSEGFRLFFHPAFRMREEVLPLLVSYHIVRVNYGEIATHEEAELFGATLLGLDVDAYYETLCVLADQLTEDGAT